MISNDIIQNSELQHCNAYTLDVNTTLIINGSMIIDPKSPISIDGEYFTAETLMKKLKLLDKLIQQYLPEELL